jgi:hypothetical protein
MVYVYMVKMKPYMFKMEKMEYVYMVKMKWDIFKMDKMRIKFRFRLYGLNKINI